MRMGWNWTFHTFPIPANTFMESWQEESNEFASSTGSLHPLECSKINPCMKKEFITFFDVFSTQTSKEAVWYATKISMSQKIREETNSYRGPPILTSSPCSHQAKVRIWVMCKMLYYKIPFKKPYRNGEGRHPLGTEPFGTWTWRCW